MIESLSIASLADCVSPAEMKLISVFSNLTSSKPLSVIVTDGLRMFPHILGWNRYQATISLFSHPWTVRDHIYCVQVEHSAG